MSDNESDYLDYQHANSVEGGPHTGRKVPPTKLIWAVVLALVLLALGIASLTLIPTR